MATKNALQGAEGMLFEIRHDDEGTPYVVLPDDDTYWSKLITPERSGLGWVAVPGHAVLASVGSGMMYPNGGGARLSPRESRPVVPFRLSEQRRTRVRRVLPSPLQCKLPHYGT
jgi:hypothetical protein